MAEIDAAIMEEREARKGFGLKEAFFGKGNFVRFAIAFVIFLLQQWAGQNSVGYAFHQYRLTNLIIRNGFQLLRTSDFSIREHKYLCAFLMVFSKLLLDRLYW